MAEFQEVMRQFDRMCKANAGCFNCPLHEPDGVSDRCSIGAFINDSERIEREVMQWAAEHPVVYPTWGDYITMIMLDDITHRNDNNPQTLGQWMNKTHIPDDVAQKLGIGPKEG